MKSLFNLLKKLLKFIRHCIIFVLWTILFIYIVRLLIYSLFNFNILSSQSWNTLFAYWNTGGVFKTTPDILLLLSLLLLPIFFIIGFIKIKKINYLQKLISFFKFFIKTPKENHERIVIKSTATPEQLIENIKSEIESIKPEKNKESQFIRSNILKKLNEEIKK